MSYWPMVKSVNRVAGSKLGEKHTVLLFDTIVSDGSVEYAFLVGVFDNATQKPVFFVSSEINRMAKELGGGSHFMGTFDGNGHANFGSSDDWGDPQKFFPAALKLAAKQFGVPVDESRT
ncbi:MAG: hypothetical protein KIS92_16245 [Planctomycetota bacterium]|nr:hypothetical protein [Planctomycetota bacterium]